MHHLVVSLCLTAAAMLLVTSPLYHVVRGLDCVSCDSWDNVSLCVQERFMLQVLDNAVNVTCDASLEVSGKKAYCRTIVRDVCQPAVFKDRDDWVGNGGAIAKRHWTGGCVYVDPTVGRMKDYSKCYWQRQRLGRDLLHKASGFQVVGRSIITRTCYCDTDLCNTIESKGCRNTARFGKERTCGPNCLQVSRNQLETPGVNEEEFRDQCPQWSNDTGKRMYEDCGTDPTRFEPDRVGPGTFRHYTYLGVTDGYRTSITSSAADVASFWLAGLVVGHHFLTYVSHFLIMVDISLTLSNSK